GASARLAAGSLAGDALGAGASSSAVRRPDREDRQAGAECRRSRGGLWRARKDPHGSRPPRCGGTLLPQRAGAVARRLSLAVLSCASLPPEWESDEGNRRIQGGAADPPGRRGCPSVVGKCRTRSRTPERSGTEVRESVVARAQLSVGAVWSRACCAGPTPLQSRRRASRSGVGAEPAGIRSSLSARNGVSRARRLRQGRHAPSTPPGSANPSGRSPYRGAWQPSRESAELRVT